jgi:hypothetical protein
MQHWDHDYCVVDLTLELMRRGFRCYLEYEIPIAQRKKAVVDLYATNKRRQILVEVGYLSQKHKGERIKLLKTLMPQALIVHVTQMKNFIPSQDWDFAHFQWLVEEHFFKENLKYGKGNGNDIY